MARKALAEAGVEAVRPAALTAVCAMLFALPILLLCLLLPLLEARSVLVQLLAIVSVVSTSGLLVRCFRNQLLQHVIMKT